MNDDKVLDLAKIEADGVKVAIFPSDIIVIVGDIQDTDSGKFRPLDLLVKSVAYTITERARKNLLKLTGFSSRLLLELTKEQLTSDINHQLKQYKSFGISVVDNQIITLFDCSKHGYLSYENILSDVKDKVFFIKGDPINRDFIQVQFNGLVRDNFIFGLNILLSSTGNFRSEFSFGIVDSFFKTYWTDVYLKKGSEDFLDKEMLSLLVDSFEKESEILYNQTKSFLEKARSVQIKNEKYLEGILTSFSGGSKIKNALIEMYSSPKEHEEILKKAGVDDGVTQLLDVFKIFTFISSNSPNIRSSISLSMEIQGWTRNVMNTLGVNNV